MRLHSGKGVNTYSLTELPIDTKVIEPVLGARLLSAEEKYEGIVFTLITGSIPTSQGTFNDKESRNKRDRN